jgi:SpoVK/Ycf46/Vps4 family AAA+-type ATPase
MFSHEALSSAPGINVIEDIDAVFNGRNNIVNPEKGLTFDCLLNTIDGVENSDGVLTIITTNHVDKIDPALGTVNGKISSRPGRIDSVVIMNPPDRSGKFKIAKRILNDYPELIEETLDEGENDSGAQFQERCTMLALNKYWEDKNKEIGYEVEKIQENLVEESA